MDLTGIDFSSWETWDFTIGLILGAISLQIWEGYLYDKIFKKN